MRAFLASATNRVPSICRTGSLFLLRRFGRNCAHGAIQINSCLLCLALTLIFCPRMVCGNIAPLPLNDGTGEQADPTSCTRKGCWNHGRCEMRDGKNESPRCFMKIRHLRGAACLRALCEAEAQSIRAYGMRNPICIIPNGVDLPRSERDAGQLQAQAFAEGRKILLYLGRLHPKKNVANLIRAWKQILNSHPSAKASWVLAIAGWSQSGYETAAQTTDY